MRSLSLGWLISQRRYDRHVLGQRAKRRWRPGEFVQAALWHRGEHALWSCRPANQSQRAARGHVYRDGRQWEAGVKVAPFGWDGYVRAALFDLEESNTLVNSPAGFQVQEGERTSQGFELEGVGYLTDDLKVTAAYTYTDSRLGDDVRYVGSTVDTSVADNTEVDSYTLFDAMVGYEFADGWQAQVNVNNLTDKEYVASCEYWCYYGESRSVIGSVKYSW